MIKVKTLKICRYGRTQYAKGYIFDVPDAVATDMVLNKDAKLIKESARDLVRKYKGIEGKHKKTTGQDIPAKPIKIKKV